MQFKITNKGKEQGFTLYKNPLTERVEIHQNNKNIEDSEEWTIGDLILNGILVVKL